jgi:hypothetical protein
MPKNYLFIIVPVVVLSVVIVGALVFFDVNPFREGEITIAMPDGTTMALKVGNSNELSDLIREGLKNKETSGPLQNSLLSIIEELSSGSRLAEKLVELAEKRKPPFNFQSVPVNLLYGNDVPDGLVAVCENSRFLSKNIVVFVLGEHEELEDRFSLYADPKQALPCGDGQETLRVNLENVDTIQRHKVLAKRTL